MVTVRDTGVSLFKPKGGSLSVKADIDFVSLLVVIIMWQKI